MQMLNDYIPEMIQTRRELHQMPEVGWQEFLTTQRIVQTVRALGFTVLLGEKLFNPKYALGRDPVAIDDAIERSLALGLSPELLKEMQGYTGCMAIFDTQRPGPVTALRFDIDCVCVEEDQTENNEAFVENFCSKRKGLMHACGHDAHTAIGLTVAKWVHDHADSLCGKVKLIFQPAEEGMRGAAGIDILITLMMLITLSVHISVFWPNFMKWELLEMHFCQRRK